MQKKQMNKFINEELSESENFSDAFFQSKHVNKRKKIFEREIKNRRKKNRIMNKNALLILEGGLERVITAHANKSYRNEEEQLFLELFSELHVDKKFFRDNYQREHFLLNKHDCRICFLDFKNNDFWIDFYTIWEKFEERFNMSYEEVSHFMKVMLTKHFNIHDMIPVAGSFTFYPFDKSF